MIAYKNGLLNFQIFLLASDLVPKPTAVTAAAFVPFSSTSITALCKTFEREILSSERLNPPLSHLTMLQKSAKNADKISGLYHFLNLFFFFIEGAIYLRMKKHHQRSGFGIVV